MSLATINRLWIRFHCLDINIPRQPIYDSVARGHILTHLSYNCSLVKDRHLEALATSCFSVTCFVSRRLASRRLRVTCEGGMIRISKSLSTAWVRVWGKIFVQTRPATSDQERHCRKDSFVCQSLSPSLQDVKEVMPRTWFRSQTVIHCPENYCGFCIKSGHRPQKSGRARKIRASEQSSNNWIFLKILCQTPVFTFSEPI